MFEHKDIGTYYNISKLFVKNYVWSVPLIILIVYCVCIVIVSNDVVCEDTAKTLIDNRISNYATIASMTLAVAGFLMSNLVKKKSFYYELLYEKTHFYIVVYYVIIGISSLMIVSLFRDTKLISKVLPGVAAAATVVVVLGLFLILRLFKLITNFTNDRKLSDYVKSGTIELMKNEIFELAIFYTSSEILVDFLKRRTPHINFVTVFAGNEIIEDIDLLKLSDFLEEDSRFFPTRIGLNSRSFSFNGLANDVVDRALNKKTFLNIFSFKKVKIKNYEIEKYLGHLYDEFVESIKKLDEDGLEDCIEAYRQILLMCTDLTSTSYRSTIQSLGSHLSGGLKVAIKSSSFNAIKKIFETINNLIFISVERNNEILFASLLDKYFYSYSEASLQSNNGEISEKKLRDILKEICERVEWIFEYSLNYQAPLSAYHNFFELGLSMTSALYRRAIFNASETDIQLINELLKKSIRYRESFKIDESNLELRNLLIDGYWSDPFKISTLEERIKKPSVDVYERHVRISCKLWIYYQANEGNIDLGSLDRYVNLINAPKIWLHDLLAFDNEEYFRRDQWYWGELDTPRKNRLDEPLWIYMAFALDKLYSGDYAFKVIEIEDARKEDFVVKLEAGNKIIKLGKLSFSSEKLEENIEQIIAEINRPVKRKQLDI